MYLELKAYQSPGGVDSPNKTKIQLNVGTPFSADTKAEIDKEKLEPKRVYDLLLYIANDLIPRIVIKANEDEKDFDIQLAKLKAMRDYGGVERTWEQFFASAPPEDIVKFRTAERAMLDDAIARMGALPMPTIHQFNLEDLSPTKLADSIMSVVNNNVPPPVKPPRY
jgi:hypothetical protein